MALDISKFGVPAQSCFGTDTQTDSGVFSISIELSILTKFKISFTRSYQEFGSNFCIFINFFSVTFQNRGGGKHYVHGHTNQ